MSVESLASLLLLGLLLGMRHALDADHVVAVGAIASRERSLRSALLIGVVWGCGHALTVMLVGGAIISLGVAVPPRLGLGMELMVALALVVLGVANLRSHRRAHAQPAASNAGSRQGLLRSLGIGIVHGLAGSAAIALLVLTTIDSPRDALSYLAVFALGTVIGMTGLTSAFAVPVALFAQRFQRAHRTMVSAAGLLSLSLGLVLAYRIGFVDGLFLANATFTPH